MQKLSGKAGINLDDKEAATVVKLNGAIMVGPAPPSHSASFLGCRRWP
ncbi:hypothetical protein G7085_05000 [Tessaracoccus sp. HDW20]|nr:hypothetical protein [Tessaracoccus coleopterorum]NHB84200.1 hypothetical protein [Tessaracoccus coleopterorum]